MLVCTCVYCCDVRLGVSSNTLPPSCTFLCPLPRQLIIFITTELLTWSETLMTKIILKFWPVCCMHGACAHQAHGVYVCGFERFEFADWGGRVYIAAVYSYIACRGRHVWYNIVCVHTFSNLTS